jgi:hypothetical protein
MEKIKFESKIISIGSETNDLYMELDMIFLDDLQNLNNVRFTKEFLADIETNKNKYIGLPLVGDMNALTNGKYDKLTHRFNKKDNSFATQALGSFIDFKTQVDNGVTQLIASARIWKRFPSVCSAIEELFNGDNGLSFSYETYVGKYTSENGVVTVDVDESNTIISSCIVSTPANPNSVALTLCAAYESDFINNDPNLLEGGECMQRNKENFTQDMMFSNTSITMIAELDVSQIQTKLYNKLKETLGEDYWRYDSISLGNDYIILKNYSTADLIKLDYKVEDNEVTVVDWYEVDRTYVKKNKGDDTVTIAELTKQVEYLKVEIASKDSVIKEKETLIAEKDAALTAKETELAEKVTQVETLSASVIEKDNLLAELEPIKEAHATLIAEKQAVELAEKQNALKEKYSKVLSAEVLAEVEIAEAITNLDESKLSAKVVEIAMASATNQTAKPSVMTASRITDNLKISGAEPDSLRSKYGI